MQAAESVDHPQSPQSDAGGWGRITGGWSGNTNEQRDVTVGGWGHRRD